jgi:hypothetical protein
VRVRVLSYAAPLLSVPHPMPSPSSLTLAYWAWASQLVRGPMVSDILGHPDERRAVASRFLRAAPALTARMLAPALYVHNAAADTFHEVPPMDLAMQSGDTLLLDHGTDILIWCARHTHTHTHTRPLAPLVYRRGGV